jgi:hypothetical protein
MVGNVATNHDRISVICSASVMARFSFFFIFGQSLRGRMGDGNRAPHRPHQGYLFGVPCELHTIKGRFSLKVKRADFARDEENSEGKTAK